MAVVVAVEDGGSDQGGRSFPQRAYNPQRCAGLRTHASDGEAVKK